MKPPNCVKNLAYRLCSPQLLFLLKRTYYARAVRRFWETDVGLMSYLVDPGDVAVDIGAHVGWYTRVLAEIVGHRGTVYSIEPVPETFRLLSSVVDALGLKNVRLVNCALSDQGGLAIMAIPVADGGVENLYRARIVEGVGSGLGGNSVAVPKISLDSMLSNCSDDIGFIKCDVEGHESFVLRGAIQVIEKWRPAWLIEVANGCSEICSRTSEVYGFLAEYGYRPYWFDGSRLRNPNPFEGAVNYFFLQPPHLRRIGDRGIAI